MPGTKLFFSASLAILLSGIASGCGPSNAEAQRQIEQAQAAQAKAERAEEAARKAQEAADKATAAAEHARKTVDDATVEINRAADHIEQIERDRDPSE